MPEGDTIHRAARMLDRALAGDEVTAFDSVYPHLDRIHEDTPLIGRNVEGVRARGKHLFMRFSGELELRTHMRMAGSWHIYRHGETWQRPRRDLRIRLETARFVVVAFNVNEAEFIRRDAALRARRRAAVEGGLGPDLMGAEFGELEIVEALARLRREPSVEVGIALLDQCNVAGIGNQYRSEIAFLAGVHPRRAVGLLDDQTLREMLLEARRLLFVNTLADDGDRRVAYRGLRRTTGSDDPAARLWVYGRAGQPCRRCETPIERGRSGVEARVVFWCPTCQPLTEVS